MVNPLANDKIPSVSPHPSPNAEEKSVKHPRGETAPTDDTVTARKKEVEDTLELSSSGQIFNQAANRARGSEAKVGTPDEAAALTDRIREQFETSGAQSLTVHRDIRADQLTNLLNSAPF